MRNVALRAADKLEHLHKRLVMFALDCPHATDEAASTKFEVRQGPMRQAIWTPDS